MGAGAGVSVKCGDYGNTYVKVVSDREVEFQVELDRSEMSAYTWGLECRKSGILTGIRFTVEDAMAMAHDYDGPDGEIVAILPETIRARAGYMGDDPIEFVIGGGYIVRELKNGDAIDISYPPGIDVEMKVRMRDGSIQECPGIFYTEKAVFHPSDLFVFLYNWGWDNDGAVSGDVHDILCGDLEEDYGDEVESEILDAHGLGSWSEATPEMFKEKQSKMDKLYTKYLDWWYGDVWDECVCDYNQSDAYGPDGNLVQRSPSRKPRSKMRCR